MAQHSSNICLCVYNGSTCVHHVDLDDACVCISCQVNGHDVMNVKRTCFHCKKPYIGTDYGLCSNCGRFQYTPEEIPS